LAAFVPADYPDIALRFANCTYFETEPLRSETTITGHPVVKLSVRSDQPDLVVIAYLLDIAADGACHYITEGHLRALHRDSIQQVSGVGVERDFARANGRPLVRGETHELCFNLLPTSHRLPAGHRVRLVITLGDSDHFAKTTPAGARLGIATGANTSTLELPIEAS
jgi:putative CocE/NonD family hydrolase